MHLRSIFQDNIRKRLRSYLHRLSQILKTMCMLSDFLQELLITGKFKTTREMDMELKIGQTELYLKVNGKIMNLMA
jgi:hypothetical protein